MLVRNPPQRQPRVTAAGIDKVEPVDTTGGLYLWPVEPGHDVA